VIVAVNMTEPALRCIGHEAKGNLKHERKSRHLRIAGRFHFLGLKSIRYEKIRTTSHTANRNSKIQSLNLHARVTQSRYHRLLVLPQAFWNGGAI